MPLALIQGTFDGFVSTDESCNSAKLWEAGVKYSYADHQFMGQYIPMISKAFWGKLSADQQKMMKDLWAAEHRRLPQERGGQRRPTRRKVLETNGIKFADPSADEAGRHPQGACWPTSTR